MIRPAGKKDGEPMLLSAVCKDILCFLLNSRDIFMLSLYSSLESFFACLGSYAISLQETVKLLFEQFLILEVDHRRHNLIVQVHGRADDI